MISGWMSSIIENVGAVLTEYLPEDGIYKYTIDVVILKSTALSRQSEMLMAHGTDFHFNLKIKNGSGLVVLLNSYAFRVGDV